MVTSAAFFNLPEQLRILGQLGFQEGVGLDQFITLSHGQVEVLLQFVVRSDLTLCFCHLLGAFFAELVVMSSKKGHLFKQDVVFLGE